MTHLTSISRFSRIRAVLGTAAVVCAALGAAYSPADGSPHGGAGRYHAQVLPGCPIAGRAEVTVPSGVDGFRVFVADARPGAATDVTVLAGGRDRTLRAFAPGEIGLALDEPLHAGRVLIALEPVLDAPVGACVARVELLRGGAVVGSAEIR